MLPCQAKAVWPTQRCVLAVVTLACHLTNMWGLPILASPHSTKNSSIPFPCQSRPCGCLTAEQCWQGDCCCYTLQEKIAWAQIHGLALPEHILRLKKNSSRNFDARGAKPFDSAPNRPDAKDAHGQDHDCPCCSRPSCHDGLTSGDTSCTQQAEMGKDEESCFQDGCCDFCCSESGEAQLCCNEWPRSSHCSQESQKAPASGSFTVRWVQGTWAAKCRPGGTPDGTSGSMTLVADFVLPPRLGHSEFFGQIRIESKILVPSVLLIPSPPPRSICSAAWS